jgi:drug/metabolite transporter (DMT)-like permease
LLAGVAFGGMNAAVGVAVRRGVDGRAGSVAIVAGACVVALPLALVTVAVGGTWSYPSIGRYALVGLVSPGIAMIAYTKAIELIGAARVAGLIGAAPVLSAALAIAFLGETVTRAVLVATLLIVAGSVLLAWDPHRPVGGLRAKGIALGAVTSASFGVQANLTKWAASAGDTHDLISVGTIFVSGTLVLVAYSVVTRRTAGPDARSFLRLAPAGVLFVVAYVCFVAAYERGRVVVVSPLTAAEALWAMLFATLLIGRAREGIGGRVLVACALVGLGTTVVAAFH